MSWKEVGEILNVTGTKARDIEYRVWILSNIKNPIN